MDEYELALEDKIVELRTCQRSKEYCSCSDCKEFIYCPLRMDYVKTVYKSMSKDKEGDFNFD